MKLLCPAESFKAAVAAHKAAPWCAAVALLALCNAAHAIGELEPNNTLATAQLIGAPGAPFVITGGRPFADTSDDFFRFQALSGGMLRIAASSPDGLADSIMGLFNGNGLLLASNDDAGGGTMSVIEFMLPTAGTYVLGLSGYNPALLSCTGSVTACYDTNGDFIFDTFVAGGGAGGSAGWDYTLSFSGVSLVPEPHAAWLWLPSLAFLGALFARRRPGLTTP